MSGGDVGPIDRKRVACAFGAALREARNRRGFSQEGLALEGNLDRTFVSLLERGLRSPTIFVVFLLAQTLRIDPARLFADEAKQLQQTGE